MRFFKKVFISIYTAISISNIISAITLVVLPVLPMDLAMNIDRVFFVRPMEWFLPPDPDVWCLGNVLLGILHILTATFSTVFVVVLGIMLLSFLIRKIFKRTDNGLAS